MSPEYPYQLVSFLDSYPVIGEGVYQGTNGWYPQIALKRRFTAFNISESELLSVISNFAARTPALRLETGQLIKPDRMPVRVIEVLNREEIKRFHVDFIEHMGDRMKSRYPHRDGENYFPHITAEYGDTFVIDVDKFALKTFVINKVCLIKDGEDTDSHAVAYFNLKGSN